MDDRRSVGPTEAALHLGVTTRTVQRWLRQGRLPAVSVGSRLRVDARALGPTVAAGTRQPGIGTVLVANRGEIVVRIARTCRSLGIRCLALVTGDQVGTWWSQQADAIVRIDSDYLDGAAIIAAARAAGADAIHPGYGFLAENPEFAAGVTAAGMTWIGPPADAIRLMGDKVAAREIAAKLGVPLLPGTDGRRQSDRALAADAERVGYPILVKPAAGGGGKGMHVARVASDLRELLERSRREAAASFGDDRLLLERYADRPRHIEIQVLFDAAGRGVHLGERECSLQRRHQKVVEEAPSPALRGRTGARLRDAMGDAAVRLGEAAGYRGAGTVEFLLDERGDFFFLEMNTRLQVEHPVTELVTGRDLVADQVRIATGAMLEDLGLTPRRRARSGDPKPKGHAIEVRLYAEDAEEGYLPSTGRIVALRWPDGDGIRVDAAVALADEVDTRYDPLLAKIVAAGRDRRDAIERLRAALAATVVLGLVTNLRLLRWIAGADWFAKGETWTDTLPTRWHPEPPTIPTEAWRDAAESLRERADPFEGGWRLNAAPRVRVAAGSEERTVEASLSGEVAAHAVVADGLASTVHLDVGGRSVSFALAQPPTVESAVRHAGHASAGARVVTAPMPGRVIAVVAREGDTVEMHEPLVVLEAMKMEHSVAAPSSGIVAAILVRAGQQVQRGDLLVELSA